MGKEDWDVGVVRCVLADSPQVDSILLHLGLWIHVVNFETILGFRK